MGKFISTGVDDLLLEKFRAVQLAKFTVGPKDSTGYDLAVEYTQQELHALFNTHKLIGGQ